MDGKYLVYFHALTDGDWPIPAGYWTGHPGINQYLYGRGPREKAIALSKESAIRMILHAREYGYPCHAEPPITITL